MHFFISHLARWLRTRHFSEPTFRPSGATNHWKNTMFRDFPTFSRICIFFLLNLSLLWSSLFYSSLLSDSSHLCFSSVHIVRSLTSKLPSMTIDGYNYPKCGKQPYARPSPKSPQMGSKKHPKYHIYWDSLGVPVPQYNLKNMKVNGEDYPIYQ